MKIITPLLAWVFVCLWQSESTAAMSGEDVPVLHWIIYLFIGVAAIIGILAVVNNKLLTGILGRLGHSSSDERGPRPGDGAVIHHSSGEADFDGTPEKMPPAAKDATQDLPYPPKRAAD
jgi:hypothetical protein